MASDRIPIEFGMGDPGCYEALVKLIRDVATLPTLDDKPRLEELRSRARWACGMPPLAGK